MPTQLQKQKLWELYNNDDDLSVDPYNVQINRSDFDIDHILPLSRGGEDILINMIPSHWTSNREKGSKLNGRINGSTFKVKPKKIVHHGYEFNYGVLIIDDEEVSWNISDFAEYEDVKITILNDLVNKINNLL